MKLTIGQNIKLVLVQSVIRVLWFVEYLGRVPHKSALYSVRFGIYLILIISVFSGFYIEARYTDLSIFTVIEGVKINNPSVLGMAVVEETPRGPILISKVDEPELTSNSALAVDMTSGNFLYELHIDTEFPPASTTKLMTALVALDLYELDEVVSIPEICTSVESQKTGFLPEEKISVDDLLHSLLINSSADAACSLAVGKISYESFIQNMNSTAEEIGLTSTNFTNPVGLDSNDGNHVSTAYDLFLLSKKAIADEYINQVVGTKEFVLGAATGFQREIRNTNDLLWNLPGTTGIKTGRTYAAGEVLSYHYEDGEKDILIIVMGSQDRFTDTKKVLEWVLKSYSWDSTGIEG
jgi:serine-type D-Ala-D-Ala carboxypeptidase (penicillin-binding protein 5/6)